MRGTRAVAALIAAGLAAVAGCTASTHAAAASAHAAAASAHGAAASAHAAGGAAGAAAKPVRCEYWTTAGGVSAVAVTSGVNCGVRSFTISAAPYLGAVFSDTGGETAYNEFLSQISEFVNGPANAPAPFGGTAPSVRGLTLIGSADNEFTNDVPVYVYKGPADVHDRAAEALDAVIHDTFVPPTQT